MPRQDGHRAGPWHLPSDPAACRSARRAVRAVLADWELEHLTHTAELLVSELVGNALLHTDGPLRLTVERRKTLRCRVEDRSREMPHRRAAAPEDENGRGLELVHRMSTNWGVEQTRDGKSVWFELG
ncbi:ATP-binding protein [Streptomyces sp. NPDC048639]|uniref:ATP-binding protein n=1 Tax=Streptomyces sp. NPDC048639 TaxID=3365581 RepID=UPI003722D8DD